MYIRPTVNVARFINPNGTRYTLRADLHNRRITSLVRREGRKARRIVRTFATRDDARDYLQVVLERRDKLGYVQTSGRRRIAGA